MSFRRGDDGDEKIQAPISQCRPSVSLEYSNLVKMDGHTFFKGKRIVKNTLTTFKNHLFKHQLANFDYP